MWKPSTPADAGKVVLFLLGIAGLAHQEITGHVYPALIPVYAIMLGLPAFAPLDRWVRRDDRKDGET